VAANLSISVLSNALNKARCLYAELLSQQINRVHNLEKESCEINNDLIKLQAVIWILSTHVIGSESNCLTDTQVFIVSQIPNSIDCCFVGTGGNGQEAIPGGGGQPLPPPSGGSYQIVGEDYVNLPQQLILNFIGDQVTVTDEPTLQTTTVFIFVEGVNVND
jgi:hypothetical protein